MSPERALQQFQTIRPPRDGAETALDRLAVETASRELRMPDDVHTEFEGNAKFLQKSLSTQPLLITAALLIVLVVILLIIFVAQNTADVEINFLWMSGRISLALAMLIAGVAGAVVAMAVAAARIIQLRRMVRRVR